MAEKEIQEISTIHVKPVSEDITTVNCTNQNALQQKISPKYVKLTQMFLARPANKTPETTELNTPKQDAPDRNKEEVEIRKVIASQENGSKEDEEERKLKAKYEAIAQMFLARPANAIADIPQVTTPKQDVPDQNKAEVKVRKVKDSQENGPKDVEEEQKLKAKYEAIAQMFLARPANGMADRSEVNTPKQDAPKSNKAEIKVRKVKDSQENGPHDDEEEQKLKAKYEAIAQMFLARPATHPDQIGEGTKIKKRVKKGDESAILLLDEERDLKDADRSAKVKRANKADKKKVKKDKQSKPSRLVGCFSFIVEWFSKKKQKRQDKKIKKEASKNSKGKSVRFCELPPDIHIYDSDECVETDARDVCKVDDVDIFFI